MANIRQKINRLRLSKTDKILMDAGILSEFGNLTDLGFRVVLDKIFQSDKDLKKAVAADVELASKQD